MKLAILAILAMILVGMAVWLSPRIGQAQTPPGAWEVACDVLVTSPTTTLTCPNLDGNADGLYRVTWLLFQVANPDVGGYRPTACTGCGIPSFRFNNNAQTQYDVYTVEGVGNTWQPATYFDQSWAQIGGDTRGERPQVIEAMINPKIGNPRTWKAGSASIELQPAFNPARDVHGGVWWNTADNITSLTFSTGVTNDIGAGSRLIVERLAVNQPTPTPTPAPTPTPTPAPHAWIDQPICDDGGTPIVGCATGSPVGWVRGQ